MTFFAGSLRLADAGLALQSMSATAANHTICMHSRTYVIATFPAAFRNAVLHI